MKFKELDFFVSTFKELNFWQFQMMKIVQKFSMLSNKILTQKMWLVIDNISIVTRNI